MEGEEYDDTQRDVKISVIDTEIRSDKFRKHVLYSISGNDHIGSFACLRRYKEFATLRYILVTNWPGFYIPQIPPKQMIVNPTQGNLAIDFIQVRKKLLNYFLTQVARFEYLYISEPFQTFIRGPTDFLKPANDLKIVNYIQLENSLQWKRQKDITSETATIRKVLMNQLGLGFLKE